MPKEETKEPMSESLAREIAAAASCDPRTVKKFWLGGRVTRLARCRIVAALKKRGVVAPK